MSYPPQMHQGTTTPDEPGVARPAVPRSDGDPKEEKRSERATLKDGGAQDKPLHPGKELLRRDASGQGNTVADRQQRDTPQPMISDERDFQAPASEGDQEMRETQSIDLSLSQDDTEDKGEAESGAIQPKPHIVGEVKETKETKVLKEPGEDEIATAQPVSVTPSIPTSSPELKDIPIPSLQQILAAYASQEVQSPNTVPDIHAQCEEAMIFPPPNPAPIQAQSTSPSRVLHDDHPMKHQTTIDPIELAIVTPTLGESFQEESPATTRGMSTEQHMTRNTMDTFPRKNPTNTKQNPGMSSSSVGANAPRANGSDDEEEQGEEDEAERDDDDENDDDQMEGNKLRVVSNGSDSD